MQLAALLRFYSNFTLDVDDMTEDEFWKDAYRLLYALNKTGQMQKK